MVDVDTASFLAITVTAAVAATAVTFGGRWVFVPVVVLELLLGIVIGPDVLGLAQWDEFVMFFSNLGLGMLFFFAGYEIDFARIRGAPLKLAAIGWIISLALAYSIGGLLALAGVVLSLLFTGSALATTAIGTLIPILDDAGELKSRFGTYLLAAGAVGEFGPILLITFLFSTDTPLTSGAVLMLFVVVAVFAALGLFVKFTKTGLALKAIAQDERAAMMLGIDSDRKALVSFALGSGLSAFAAILILPLGSIVVETGYNVLIYSIAVSIIGGLGSWGGAIVASFIIGFAQILTEVFLSTQYQMVISLLAIIVTLLLKPSGIFGKQKELDDRV